MKINMNEKGQTLLEALVALGAAVMVVSAITVSVITALNNGEYTKNQNLATQYAQQGLELMHQLSLSDWATFSSYSGGYCFGQGMTVPDSNQKTPNCTKPNLGIFYREVDFPGNVSCTAGSSGVTVSVAWSDGKCTDVNNPYCHVVSLNSCFYNLYNNVQAP